MASNLPSHSTPGPSCDNTVSDLSIPHIPFPSIKPDNSQIEQSSSFTEKFDIITNLYSLIKQDNILIKLPDRWGYHKLEEHIVFSKLAVWNDLPYIERTVVLTNNTMCAVASNKSLDIMGFVTTIENLEDYIKMVDDKHICKGLSPSCEIFLSAYANECRLCSKYSSFLRRKIEKKRKCVIAKKIKIKQQFYIRKRNRQLESIIINMKKKIIDSNKLENYIRHLPVNQQEMIKTCCKASQCKKTGKRYTLDWMYSCILIKIKSPKLYNHMRENNILPLPSPSTLSRYIRNLDGSFGFQKEVFSLLKEKTKHLEDWEKHGSLLVDECKITKTKKFYKNLMDFIGFVDLGDYTPETNKDNLGDHALILMFQPFAGRGLQALACFLSGGDVTGEILSKIILECVILCENAGLYIDVITSDGATWNRKMWKHLGVENSLEPWCEHPMDASRNLRMCSDFPHLIKCLRNNLMLKKKFRIPEGLVLFSHFKNLFEYESKKEFKMAFKLTESHIHPKYGEKMNTRLAFQLYSNSTALALETYQEKSVFENVDPTITFCKRIDKLIDIMNSSSTDTGLKQNSQEYLDLDTFLIYLDLWKQCSPPEIFLSDSTFHGLRATISCTLDLTKYLTKLGFKYLMTSRINQDHLEHFFGMMRAAGGCNTHPESIQVGQIFRLMSLYSLIKPPRGSNVTGGEMMRSLLQVGDLKKKKQTIIFDLQIGNDFREIEEEFSEVKVLHTSVVMLPKK